MRHAIAAKAAAAVLALLLAACSTSDAIRTARIIATGDVAGAQAMAAEKAARYALNPQSLAWDLKKFKQRLDDFRKAVEDAWGKDERREPTPKKYVKYTRNYRSRASVDFDTGLVTVETLDDENPAASLQSAVITTVLAPADPRSLDLYSDSEVKLGETPFLLGEVKDFDGKDIRWAWRAERFAKALVDKGTTRRTVKTASGPATAHGVSFHLIKDHLHVRAAKYAGLVAKNADEFKISKNLVYAVMKTESDFNPFAASAAPAFGLMQIVPRSAGAEVTKYLTGKQGKPDKEFLFKPANNILYGTAYLHILDTTPPGQDHRPRVARILHDRRLQRRLRHRPQELRQGPRQGRRAHQRPHPPPRSTTTCAPRSPTPKPAATSPRSWPTRNSSSGWPGGRGPWAGAGGAAPRCLPPAAKGNDSLWNPHMGTRRTGGRPSLTQTTGGRFPFSRTRALAIMPGCVPARKRKAAPIYLVKKGLPPVRRVPI